MLAGADSHELFHIGTQEGDGMSVPGTQPEAAGSLLYFFFFLEAFFKVSSLLVEMFEWNVHT